MMNYLTLMTILLYGQLVVAHTVFSKLSLNYGPVSKTWQYIRNVDEGFAYSYWDNYVPLYEPYSTDIRCGRGATTKGNNVETLSVDAGDTVSIYATQHNSNKSEEVDLALYHEGTVQAYLSPVSTSLEDATGDSVWFKIGSIGWTGKGTTNSELWGAYRRPYINFTIPETTPPSKYLMRFEIAFPFSPNFNNTQFYVNCAHIEVKGAGGGTPGPLVKFPGAYDGFDRSLWVPRLVSYAPANLQNISSQWYKAPGPEVWTG